MSGFTKLPNHVIDDIMPNVAPNTFRVIVAVYRQTVGWNRARDVISLTQFHELTGISSRRTLSAAIQDAIDGGYICRQVSGLSFWYAPTSTETVPLPVPKRYTQKTYKDNKEKDKGKTGERAHAREAQAPITSNPPLIHTGSLDRSDTRNTPARYRPPVDSADTGHPAMIAALAAVTGRDANMQRSALSYPAQRLTEHGYTPLQVVAHFGRTDPGADSWWWYRDDWRGRRRDLPTLQLVQDLIAGAVDFEPIGLVGSTAGKHTQTLASNLALLTGD